MIIYTLGFITLSKNEHFKAGKCSKKYSVLFLLYIYDTGRSSVTLVFAIGVLLVAFIHILILLFKFAYYGRHLKTLWSFITDFQLWVEVPKLLFSIIFVSVFGTPCLCPTGWQWQIGTIAVLLIWFDLIIVMRNLQVFDIGTYYCSVVMQIAVCDRIPYSG